ncbi:MAG: GGDEF domain-containing protein [Acetatifactor sp.]|nr:GGDEF domain-containing protein [Acetatifactor sp.]
MGNLKRIALITSASNFERQKNIATSMHRTLKSMGGYVLYVISNFGIFLDDKPIPYGDTTIYDLIDYTMFDGCVIGGNIGSHPLLASIAKKLRKKNIPFITVNIQTEGAPFLSLDSYPTACKLMEHLIETHDCKKINLVLTSIKEVISMETLTAYQDTLKKYGLPYEEDRIIYCPISVNSGRGLYQTFCDNHVDDADAVLCVQDIVAIGLYLELEKQGIKVPQDLLICTLNRSSNSVIFRPDFTGADRRDGLLAEKACHLLIEMINGNKIPLENYSSGKIYYGESCGCHSEYLPESRKWHQQLIRQTAESGRQINYIMQFNDTLETVTSLEELGDNIRHMLHEILCPEFFCCINKQDLKYIINDPDYEPLPEGKSLDDTLVAITGTADRIGTLQNFAYPTEKIVPVEEQDGDLFILYPLRHKDKLYGYMVFLNVYLPIEAYNYRICHESICSSIENLRRQMILRSSIKELDKLHMRDQMTGLYNRFALNRFASRFVDEKVYSIAMIDMDGLKKINDNFGHLSGNHAICITANVIQECTDEKDLVIRYGGDEFLILSHHLEPEYWETLRTKMNDILTQTKKQQQLPYELSISLGFAISTAEQTLTYAETCELADHAMYENKMLRKKGREKEH